MVVLFFIVGWLLVLVPGMIERQIQKKEGKWYELPFDKDVPQVAGTIFVILSIIAGIIAILVIGFDTRTIDKNVAMYQEANAKIEEDIDDMVKNYMAYEHITLSEFKTGDGINLVQLYPELKANELVQKQIDIHVENNAKIMDLKQQKNNLAGWKFVLYFGGGNSQEALL